MRYEVKIVPSAIRCLARLDKPLQTRIGRAIDSLADIARPCGCKKLSDGFWRVRVGDYRIVNEVSDEAVTVLVIRIGHRRDVYQEGR